MNRPANVPHDNLKEGIIRRGFTVLELLIVVAIIGVLSTITIVSYSSIQSGSRDTQRSSRLKIISEALEKYYQQYGQYPDCDAMIASPSVVADTLKNLDPDVLTTPSDAKGTNSFICDMEPATDKFAYHGGGAEYTLQYKEEGSGDVKSVLSRKQDVNGMFNLTFAVVPLGGGTVSGSGSYEINATPTMSATAAQFYQFSSWTGSTGCAGAASHTITMDDDKACTANFVPTTVTAPAAPVVSTNTVGATTTWSWGAATCTGGSTAQYQYYYTNSVGYDSGWVGPQTGLSVPLTTSTEGVTYTVAVQARCHNPTMDSAWSASGSAGYTRINTVPNPITATPTPGSTSTSINVVWTAVSGATNYKLQRDTNSGFTGAVEVYSGTATSFTDSGRSQGVTYYYRANETGPGGTSQWSTTDSATTTINLPTPTTPATTPVPPSTVGATTTWTFSAETCPSGTTLQYRYLYTYTPSGSSGWIATTTPSYAPTTSTEGVTYDVVIQARCYTGVADSGWTGSSASNPYTRINPVPNPVCSTASSTSITCTWPAVAGATDYALQIDDNSGFSSPTPATTTNLTYTFLSLPQGTTHYIRANATGAGGTSLWSTTDSATTTIDLPAPNPPTTSDSTVGATTTWTFSTETCPSGTTREYRYYYSISSPAWNSGWVPTAATSIGFTTSTEGVTYDLIIQARCYTGAATSAWTSSSASNPYTRINPVPNPVCSTASSTSIGCTWPAVTDATSYTLQIDDNSGFSSPTPVTPVGLSHTFSSLPQGVTQYIRASATGPGGTSQWSTTDSATTTINLPTPTTPATTPVPPSTVGATTTWTFSAETCPSGTTLQYRYLYTYTPSGSSGWIATTTPSYAPTTSTEGVTYDVVIQARCYTGVADSGWTGSSASNPYTRINPVPNPVCSTASSTSITCTWPAVAGATDYALQIDDNSGFSSPTPATTTNLTYTFLSLPQGTTHYIRANATGAGGTSLWSTTDSATTTIDLPAPNPPTTSDSTVGATTTWTFSTETCPSGTTREYRYYYSISSPAWNSGWVPTAATSIGFTTSTEGVTYDLIIQARCYTGAATSAWTSSSASNPYTRINPVRKPCLFDGFQHIDWLYVAGGY